MKDLCSEIVSVDEKIRVEDTDRPEIANKIVEDENHVVGIEAEVEFDESANLAESNGNGG